MTRAGGRALRVAAIALIVAALAIAAIRRGPHELGPRPGSHRPKLLLLTSLPLLFSEDFSLKGGGSPALERLATRYRLVPISVSSPSELARGRLLLMAQPSAQTPENLVALDAWVRDGGHVLLLADPMLEWPSKRPLGDPLRPPLMFVDTGLLAHWGLRLDAPDKRGPAARILAGIRIVTVSPGELYGDCAIGADRLVANCRIGRGQAVIVADADLLDVPGGAPAAENNLNAFLSELARLERK